MVSGQPARRAGVAGLEPGTVRHIEGRQVDGRDLRCGLRRSGHPSCTDLLSPLTAASSSRPGDQLGASVNDLDVPGFLRLRQACRRSAPSAKRLSPPPPTLRPVGSAGASSSVPIARSGIRLSYRR